MAQAKTKAPEVVAPEVKGDVKKTQTKVEKPKPVMTAEQKKVTDGFKTVSARIRYLDDEGYARAEIPKLITNATGGPLRYQHVRGVLEARVTTPKES